MQEITCEKVSEHLNTQHLCFEECTGLYYGLSGDCVDGWLSFCYLRHRTIIKHFSVGLLNRKRIKKLLRIFEWIFIPFFAFSCASSFSDLNFAASSTFSPCLILSSLVSWSALVNMKAFFSYLVVLLKSLGGVKSVFAKTNLYDLLGYSVFRFLPALWEMQQAEPSFLCRIINSVAVLVHMFQVRQNRELYLCLLYPSLKMGSAGCRHMFFLFPPATSGYQCWRNTAYFRVWELWGLGCLLALPSELRLP